MTRSLLEKYNVPGPRYTSYPTVPFWESDGFDDRAWTECLERCVAESNDGEGASIYVHLPFCESPCTFCGCIKKFTRNHALEEPYVEDVIREWALYRPHFCAPPLVQAMHLGGGTPTFFSPANLSRIVDAIIGSAHVGERFDFSFEANPSSTTEEHLRSMRALGFRRISLGVQDFDPVVQRTINRVQPFQEVAAVTDAARALDYGSVNFDLIYGLPRQRLASIVETMSKVVTLRPDRIAFYGYAHVPWAHGSSQRRFAEAEIPRGEQKRALYEIGRDLLLEAGYREIGMDHFALETDSLYRSAVDHTLHRNFMGYTPVHTRLCIGLGMSAISDAWYAYAQNERSVDAYHARIDAGQLPVFRGHRLSEEDLLLRDLILDLMCRYETLLPGDSASSDVLGQCRERLSELLADGLVQIEGSRVRVTDAGRPFVRNACMAFDARLWRSDTGARLFSDTI